MSNIDTGTGAALTALSSIGWLKLATLGAAAGGALLMAVFRPPKTRSEAFKQGVVALGSSLLFGGLVASAILHKWQLININSLDDLITYTVAIHGLVGALSWGIFGGLATLRDKVNDPLQAVKDVKAIL